MRPPWVPRPRRASAPEPLQRREERAGLERRRWYREQEIAALRGGRARPRADLDAVPDQVLEAELAAARAAAARRR